jgi:hypothetical protein
MDKKVLVRTDQAEMTKGKNVVVSNELHNRKIKPHNSEIGVWKENVLRKLAKRVKPTSTLLIENINENWRKTGGTGLPKVSNGTNSLKPRTDQISRNHGAQRTPRRGWCITLWIGNP